MRLTSGARVAAREGDEEKATDRRVFAQKRKAPEWEGGERESFPEM